MNNECLSDWDTVLSFLPENWQDKFKELGVLKFGRKFSGNDKESRLLRVLFMHLADGMSLRVTATQARLTNLADISDVGILARLRKSASWFEWCTQKMLLANTAHPANMPISGMRFRAVDASMVKEPGPTGSQFRLHYAMNLCSLAPEEIKITDQKQGESFRNFSVSKNDLMFGDRAYANAPGIAYVTNCGGHALCRFSPSNLPLYSAEDHTKRFLVMPRLRRLSYGECGDWSVFIRFNDQLIKARVCAMKKSPEAAEKERSEILREASKRQRKTSETTLELAGYMLIITTLADEKYSAEFVVKCYHLRWQIELLFKRLKSILEVGCLPKYDDECARAYLAGKIMISVLIETIIRRADDFFPYRNDLIATEKHLA
jgi:hypothetical protein